jgi:lipopolysaccharide transport system ATP-binding protein
VDAADNQSSQVDKRNSIFWALRDISFEVPEGKVIGIIGKNGAGKSTLLKILSHITEPTSGQAILSGRVASLLEVGTGFHPELTGRENIYLNGTILGMKKTEITKRFDDIVSFADITKFIDTPVKRYSSGMYVRLAFAVAAHLEPEIMLVDEVLAVGDAEFQRKCLGKMKEVAGHGRTILFVSHRMSAIKSLCEQVMLIEEGRLAEYGNPGEIVARYLNRNLIHSAVVSEKEIEPRMEGNIKSESPSARFKEISIRDNNGNCRNIFNSDEEIIVSIDFRCLKQVKELTVFVKIVDEHDVPIILGLNVDEKAITDSYYHLKPGNYRCSAAFPKNLFHNRSYYLTVQLLAPRQEYIIVNKILEFTVTFEGYNGFHKFRGDCYIRPKLKWTMKSIKEDRENEGVL